ncbi:uncharacterized protein LOC124174158 [Ischnura elegans]|uniref:uncharacterized protein LOC124174158 n=1 Tax=Ischnura elegans TaxID=197161 RepID=UPI001ED8B761|nr:uncharacterized protein LOC124174158 [Ischnura elegans]
MKGPWVALAAAASLLLLCPPLEATNATAASLEDEFLDEVTGQCVKDPSMSCLRKNLYGYVGRSLDQEQLAITDSLVFTKKEGGRAGKSVEAPVEAPVEATGEDGLYEKGARFLMDHDVSIQLPQTLFGGSVLKLSPRSFEEDGVLLKLEMAEGRGVQEGPEGRLFFHSHKKHHFKKRLIMGFFALLLVIKLIKVKVLYLLPLILGVGTVKKLILKALIFIFPAFASLFKYCSGYKTHHHHTVAYHHRPYEPTIFNDWGPFGGAYHRRNEFSSSGEALEPSLEDERPTRFQYPPAPHPNAHLKAPPKQAAYGPAPAKYAPRPAQTSPVRYQPAIQQRPQQPLATASLVAGPVHIATAGGNQKVYSAAGGGAEEAARVAQLQQAALQQQALLQAQALALQRQEQLQRQQAALLLQQQRAQALTPKPVVVAAAKVETTPTYDSFYSPILQRMDGVFGQMGFKDEGCKERVVCSMYKRPARYSPHSNLISAELSRDPSELKKPTTSNGAVVRFYRFVQAAKDGQEGRDCLRLHPRCNINTEK